MADFQLLRAARLVVCLRASSTRWTSVGADHAFAANRAPSTPYLGSWHKGVACTSTGYKTGSTHGAWARSRRLS